MQNNSISESLTYVSEKPDIKSLRYSYEQSVTELESYFDLCRRSYDDRRNWWPGKSRDLRKHGADAFPWEGASDMESHVIDERITRLVSLFLSAMSRANIRAFPVEFADIPRSKVVSNFLKWMVTSGYIPRFKREMELGANYMLERGLLITYVGWHREDRTFLQRLSLQQITELSPEVGAMISEGSDEEEVIRMLQASFDGVSQKRAKKAVNDLRTMGIAELPIVKRQVDAPEVKTLAPDGDFIFPPYVTDPQRAPYCFWKTYYTPQELQNKIITDDWDEDFVDFVIERYRGVNIDSIEREQEGRRSLSLTDNAYEAEELIEIVYGYQRLIDKEDGSEGIYCTVFHRDFDGNETAPGYAKFELLNGYEDYPVVVTKLSEDSKRLYDTTTIPSLLRGIQNQVKIERDSRIDRNSISTLPPIMHPIGQAPSDWGPGRLIPYRRKGDIEFGPVPLYNPGSVEMENTQEDQADRLVGLDQGNPLSQIRQQFLVDKFLSHISEVIVQCYRCFQRFGPDSIFFRVTGVPDPQMFNKGNPDENFDVTISYDVLNTDPEKQENKLNSMISLLQLDKNGRINVDNLVTLIAGSVDPVLADSVLQPVEEAQQQILKDVTDDLSKIYAGIEMPARPNGAEVAMQILQSYIQQPDIAARLQSDQAFSERLQKYMGQYQFSMQQAQNAQIGRIGTAPAEMGGVQTQQMQQS
tara:strand:- start:455 stop:2548 length:2094 start_codon:yes stop_codon:yes gene_type:complete